MKTGRSISELAQEVRHARDYGKDFSVDTRAMESFEAIDGHGVGVGFSLGGVEESHTATDLAHGQIATAAKIPKAYYDRMRAECPHLLASNINHWWTKGDPKKRLVRTDSRDNSIRAFLSDRYRPLDNFELMGAIMPQFESSDLQMKSCELTESRLYLKAVSPRLQGEVKVGDVVQGGICLSNSEVGQGSLRIDEFLYRLSCTNGMTQETTVRKTHLGRSTGVDSVDFASEFYKDDTRKLDDAAFWAKIRDAVEAIFDAKRWEDRLDQLRETTERRIEGDIPRAVRVVQRRFGMSDDESTDVLNNLIRSDDACTQWGLANAITRAAEDRESYDRATEFEQFGGRLINLKPREWQEIATAA